MLYNIVWKIKILAEINRGTYKMLGHIGIHLEHKKRIEKRKVTPNKCT